MLHQVGELPRIVLGTGGHRGLQKKEGRAAMLAALRMGYRALDTCEMNRMGISHMQG